MSRGGRCRGVSDEALEFRALPDARLPTSTNQVGPGPAFHGGVVTTTEPLAANVGRDILALGGNAVDAAVAVQFMLNVLEPQSSGMGGGGFMLIHFAGAPPGETIVIDFRDVAPANATIGMFDTSASSAVKGSSGYAVGVPGAQQKQASTKEDQEHEGVDTTHYTIIDEAGNVVSVTSTISDLWGTGLMVRGRGFMLNNQLLNFNDDPQGTTANPAANDVEGGKSPRTTIAPTLVFLGDELVAGYGSPGGTGIINAILQVTLNLIDHDLSLQTAVQRPRISLDSGSSSADTEIESGFAASVRSSLQNMGYDFDSTSSIGAVQAIVTCPGGGQQYGAADTRRIGGVSGLDQH